jgi:hypothetical protein
MKRAFTFALATTALLAALAASTAVGAGESGPKCANITGETHNYVAVSANTYRLGLELLLGAPACQQITYTLYVVQDTGATPVAVDQTGASATGNPQFVTTVTDDDTVICVFATSASQGGHVHDRAPDTGCLEIAAGSSGGGSGFG